MGNALYHNTASPQNTSSPQLASKSTPVNSSSAAATRPLIASLHEPKSANPHAVLCHIASFLSEDDLCTMSTLNSHYRRIENLLWRQKYEITVVSRNAVQLVPQTHSASSTHDSFLVEHKKETMAYSIVTQKLHAFLSEHNPLLPHPPPGGGGDDDDTWDSTDLSSSTHHNKTHSPHTQEPPSPTHATPLSRMPQQRSPQESNEHASSMVTSTAPHTPSSVTSNARTSATFTHTYSHTSTLSFSSIGTNTILLPQDASPETQVSHFVHQILSIFIESEQHSSSSSSPTHMLDDLHTPQCTRAHYTDSSRVLLELPLDSPSDAETPTNSDASSSDDWDVTSPVSRTPSALHTFPPQDAPGADTILAAADASSTSDATSAHITLKLHNRLTADPAASSSSTEQPSLGAQRPNPLPAAPPPPVYSPQQIHSITLMLSNPNILKESFLSSDNLCTMQLCKQLKPLNQSNMKSPIHRLFPELFLNNNNISIEGTKIKLIFIQRPDFSLSPIFSSFQQSQFCSQEPLSVISALIVGPFLLYYDEHHRLVVPKKLTGEALALTANHFIPLVEICHLSFFDIRSILALVVVDFNRIRSRFYKSAQANAQIFCDAVLGALGLNGVLRLEECGIAFSNIVKDLRKCGTSELNFIIDHDASYSTVIRLKNHHQLDTFVSVLLREQPTFPLENVFDFSLLRCFDHVLRRQMLEGEEESTKLCPFSIFVDL